MRIGKRLIVHLDHEPKLDAETLSSIDEEYAQLQKQGRRLVLGTLVSRAGTKWLCDIFDAHKNATGRPEPSFEAASFYRYIKYNKLPIDTSGILAIIKYWIVEDWKKKGDLALVFSPHFSHGLLELYAELKPDKIIFALNDPKFTVQSMYNKRQFTQYYFREDNEKALGYQPALAGSWSFMWGRLVPNGPFYDTWKDMTRIGKLAWFGNMVNRDIYSQLEMLPQHAWEVFHLKAADQNYEWYLELAERYSLFPLLSKTAFLKLKKLKNKPSENTPHVWSEREVEEYTAHTKEWTAIYNKLCTD